MNLFFANNDDELISQLAQLGIKPHYYTEEEQQLKYRRWEKELSQGRRRRFNKEREKNKREK